MKYHSSLPEFLQVRLVGNRTAVNSLRDEIDEGEAQAIILAEELQADALLIDDKQGRTVAENRGIPCLGLAGAILLAKQSGLIRSVGDILNSLETQASFYLDAGLKQTLLIRAKEVK